jgi:CheY-like chemotaxis protein
MTNVLVVDDNPDIVRLISAFLRGANYAVTPAYSGEEAIDYLQESGSDIMLLDLMMPGLSGIETIELLRKQNINVPIIVITAKELTAADLADLKNYGVECIIIKDDLSRTILLEKIKEQLGELNL